nr:response regulator transcription factor [uncultured Massilia sp.]
MLLPHPTPIRLLIADDHLLMRTGIAAALRAQGGMDVVGEAANGEEAVVQFVRHRPDVALIDLQMPVKNGLEAIAGIRARYPDARIIVLTTFAGDARIMAALKAGAAAYLLKDVRGAELAQAVRSVHQGARAIAPEAKQEIAGYHEADALSPRELAVLQLAAAGNSNRMIGDLLHIGETTVKSHMSTILVKLGANDRTHAVTMAAKRGFISL